MTIALDVSIGVVFLYLLLALIVTTVQELGATVLRFRAKHLYDAIAGMLEGTDSEGLQPLKAFLKHPLIRNLSDEAIGDDGKLVGWRNRGMPSYIPSKTFALALVDVLRGNTTPSQLAGVSPLLADAREAIKKLPKDSRAARALNLLLKDAEALTSDIDKQTKLVSDRIEGWFNDRMARASGWYKRKAQVWSLVIAAVVTFLANADTIHVVDRLWGDAALRTAVAASAQQFVQSQPATPASGATTPSTDDPTVDAKVKIKLALAQAEQLKSSQLPVGWHWLPAYGDKSDSPKSGLCVRAEPGDGKARCWSADHIDYVLVFVGWLITALAVSLGAGFWFDTLSKVLSLRGSGPRVSETNGKVEAG